MQGERAGTDHQRTDGFPSIAVVVAATCCFIREHTKTSPGIRLV